MVGGVASVRAECRAMVRALRPGAPAPWALVVARQRLEVLEAAERRRVSERRSAARRERLSAAVAGFAVGPAVAGEVWIAARLPDGSLASIGDASRDSWALTCNGEAVAWFRGQRECEAAARGAARGRRAESHADMVVGARILLERLYGVHAARGSKRRAECAELEWELRRVVEGWADPVVVDRMARSRRGDVGRWLERLGAVRPVKSMWDPAMPDPEEVFQVGDGFVMVPGAGRSGGRAPGRLLAVRDGVATVAVGGRVLEMQADIFGGEVPVAAPAPREASEQLAMGFGDTPNRGQTSMEGTG